MAVINSISASLLAASAVISATAVHQIQPTGSPIELAAQSASVSATVASNVGALNLQLAAGSASLQASVFRVIKEKGSGAQALAQPAGVESTGSTTLVSTSAALVAGPASMLSLAKVTRVGAAALVAQSAQLMGLGATVETGSGSLVAQRASVSASVKKILDLSPALAGQAAQVAGTGQRAVTATDGLVAQSASITATATASPSGGGQTVIVDLLAQSATLVSADEVIRKAVANLQAGSAELLVVPGERIVVGTGALVGQSAVVGANAIAARYTTWEQTDRRWGAATLIYADHRPIFNKDRIFYQIDRGVAFDTFEIPVELERLGIAMIGRDQQGRAKIDPTSIKFVSEIYPVFKGEPGTIVNISLGGQITPEDPIIWEGPRPFTLGSSVFLDFTISGRFLAVKFESLGQLPWELISYEYKLRLAGRR